MIVPIHEGRRKMRKLNVIFCWLFCFGSLVVNGTTAMAFGNPENISQRALLPEPLPAEFSADGKTVLHGRSLKAVVYDPSPPATLSRIPPPAMALVPEKITATTFSITYVQAGGTDAWGEPCYAFPTNAKTAFNAASNVWANIVNSSVPITITACWASLGSPTTLGYSAAGGVIRDFPAAPRANTWYAFSLANALAGYDLTPSYQDIHITLNSLLSWYYGTDGNVPFYQMDLMTVILHEITHGLHFSGTMENVGGLGYWGLGGYPDIYDVFMRDGGGTPLLYYYSPSMALGNVLVSNNIWFHGANAAAANGNKRVRMYAPYTWAYGSSYSHLDYTTFNNTANQLMVYAFSNGESVHDPGTVTIGLLKDLGWPALSLPTVTTKAVSGVSAGSATGNGSITSLGFPNPTQHGFCWNTSGNPTKADTCTYQGGVTAVGTFSGSLSKLVSSKTYYVRAYVTNSAGTAYGGQVCFTTKPTLAPIYQLLKTAP